MDDALCRSIDWCRFLLEYLSPTCTFRLNRIASGESTTAQKNHGLTEHVVAHLTRSLGIRVVQTNDEERFVEHIQTHSIPNVHPQRLSMSGPDSSRLSRQYTQC